MYTISNLTFCNLTSRAHEVPSTLVNILVNLTLHNLTLCNLTSYACEVPSTLTLRVSVELSPPLPKVTSHGHEVTLGPLCRVAPFTIQSHLKPIFSPHVHILTSHTYSHLVCPPPSFKVTLHTHSYLVYTFSPHIHILTSHAPSTTQSHLVPTSSTHSHLAYIFSPRMLPSTQNNIFHLMRPCEVTFSSKWSRAPTRGDFALYKAKL